MLAAPNAELATAVGFEILQPQTFVSLVLHISYIQEMAEAEAGLAALNVKLAVTSQSHHTVYSVQLRCCLQEMAEAEADLAALNVKLAAAVAARNMAEPRARLAAEEARVHTENAVVNRLLNPALQ